MEAGNVTNNSYIPDNQAVYHYLTGRQYLDLISSFYDISKAAKEERIANLVYMLQMEDVIHKPVSAYSRGMKQKLLIMAAIIHEPNLIVMDEPFTGLDPSTVEQLIKVINAERERGAGILFSSHMLDIVTRISDKVVVIKNGNILIDDEIANVNHSGCLQKLLVGESNESAE